LDEKISIIIPVYNEEKIIKETLRGLIDANIKNLGEIIVVDDGSLDKTKSRVNEIKSPLIKYHKLARNLGKGAALRKGVELSSYPVIAFLDGDIGYSSKEITKLLKAIYDNRADLVIAEFPPASVKGGFGIVKNISRKGVYFFTGKNIKNPLCGQRVFRKKILSYIDIPEGFGVEVGMLIDILNHGLRVEEIPVLMTHRETKRDLKGFIHRGKELIHILTVLIKKSYQYKNPRNRR
jgi:glycosyltransferase involved in cell wall biosynthesis